MNCKFKRKLPIPQVLKQEYPVTEAMAKVKVTLKRSLIGRPETQRRTVRALGLRKVNSVSNLPDHPAVRGQLHKVEHLISVEEIAE